MVENQSLQQMNNNPVIQSILATDKRFNAMSSEADLRRIKDILTNGKGPFIFEGATGLNNVATTVGNLYSTAANSDIFLRPALLKVLNGMDASKLTKISSLNDDQVAAMFAVYETLLHEAVHILAMQKGINEEKEKIELGNKFERIANPLKFDLYDESSSFTAGQQQLNRGTDVSSYPITMNRAGASIYFNGSFDVSSAISSFRGLRSRLRGLFKKKPLNRHKTVRHL